MTLSVGQQKPVPHQEELLLEIEEQGTPLRIDGKRETYYVLSASQLSVLMGRLIDDVSNINDITGFTLEDFGLTEIDLAEYHKTQHAQRERVATAEPKPLPIELSEQLLEASHGLSDDDATRATPLRELEAAMLANLHAAANAA